MWENDAHWGRPGYQIGVNSAGQSSGSVLDDALRARQVTYAAGQWSRNHAAAITSTISDPWMQRIETIVAPPSGFRPATYSFAET